MKESKRTNRPFITVIMAAYNEKEKIVREAIESVLNQTYSNFELLIFDDSTEETTKKAIDSYCSDSRVVIYRNARREGFVTSLNHGLAIAKGKYIARMDADDIACRDRFEKQISYLDHHPKTDVLGGQVDIIDESGTKIGTRKYPLKGLKLKIFFCYRTPVAHPSVMFRRTIIDSGLKYNINLKRAEDIDFWLRVHNAGYRIENLPDVIVKYRVGQDFIEKRVNNKEQENYVIRIRRDNFSRKHLVFSTVSWLMTYVRYYYPDKLKTRIYKKENSGK